MSTPHPHLEQNLQRGIDHLRLKFAEMASLAERAIQSAIKALLTGDRKLAYSVVLRDQYIDELETDIDRLCLEFLARQQPVAGQLRFIFASIQINRELERIGDYAESVARQVLALSSHKPLPSYDKYIELGDLALHMLKDAVQSFLQQDPDLARRTIIIEERANTLRSSINVELAGMLSEGKMSSAAHGAYVTIARRLERVTDQAKNMCEEVLYMCTGEFIKHKGGLGFRISFLDAHNGCVTQMAEAIGRAMNLPRFHFMSAGLVPKPTPPVLAQFCAAKGMNLSQQKAKSLEQAPEWEACQIIVCFDAKTREVVAAHQGKSILLDWSVKDPCAQGGTPKAEELEATYETLQTNIRELTSAIIEDPKAP